MLIHASSALSSPISCWTRNFISFAALFDGSWMREFEQYYTETFPARDKMLEINRDLNKFYYFSGSEEENLLLIEGSTGAESGGESLDEVEANVQEMLQPNEQAPVEEEPIVEESPIEEPVEEPVVEVKQEPVKTENIKFTEVRKVVKKEEKVTKSFFQKVLDFINSLF